MVCNVKRERAAVIGVAGIKKILLGAYNAVTGNALKPCDNEAEALEYLTKD